MRGALSRRFRAAFVADEEPPLWTRAFLLVCGTQLLAYSSYAAIHPTFAVYLETITHSESLIGVAFGAFTFAAVVARPVAGWLLDRVGRRGVQAIAAVALAGTTFSFTWATVTWVAIGLRVLHGLAWGVSSTATPTIAADVVPSVRQSEGFAYFGIVPNIALMMLPPAGLWIAHRYGFVMQFAGAALLALLVLGPLAALEETTPATRSAGEFYAPEALPAAALVALGSIPVGAIDALLPLYAPTVGLNNAGLFFTVMGGAILLTRAVRGRLPGSIPALLLVSFVCQSAGLALLALAPRLLVINRLPLGLLAGAAVFGVGFALVFPLLQSVAVAATPESKNGSATATILIGMDLGVGLGAIGFGVLGDLVSFASMYTAAAVVSLIGVLATVVVNLEDSTH
ncbi:MFS transporter [Natronorubrum aibiense]|uniref:MFS transporter n=1 Tax=Natronorubrum aibiense TaxID=348826 RepID=A0A5P9P8G0_9EURY|nr:MFS transporter [Natronorubrum aibiense]QFU84413.1 MFS transporter [Natronorubrum aibiense]